MDPILRIHNIEYSTWSIYSLGLGLLSFFGFLYCFSILITPIGPNTPALKPILKFILTYSSIPFSLASIFFGVIGVFEASKRNIKRVLYSSFGIFLNIIPILTILYFLLF